MECVKDFLLWGEQTRERVNDEVLEEGGTQSRPPVAALLERHTRSQRSLAAHLWAGSMGAGSQGEPALFLCHAPKTVHGQQTCFLRLHLALA